MNPIQNKLDSITIEFKVIKPDYYDYTRHIDSTWFNNYCLLPFKNKSTYTFPFFEYTIKRVSLLPVEHAKIIVVKFVKYPNNKIDDFDFLDMIANFLSFVNKLNKNPRSPTIHIHLGSILYNNGYECPITQKFF